MPLLVRQISPSRTFAATTEKLAHRLRRACFEGAKTLELSTRIRRDQNHDRRPGREGDHRPDERLRLSVPLGRPDGRGRLSPYRSCQASETLPLKAHRAPRVGPSDDGSLGVA